jgi:hypothetical protein
MFNKYDNHWFSVPSFIKLGTCCLKEQLFDFPDDQFSDEEDIENVHTKSYLTKPVEQTPASDQIHPA